MAQWNAVADPGFPMGGMDPLGGCGPPTWVLFGENVCKNVCENERVGSCGEGGVRPARALDPPMEWLNQWITEVKQV